MNRTFVGTLISVTQEQSKSYANAQACTNPLALMSLQPNDRDRPPLEHQVHLFLYRHVSVPEVDLLTLILGIRSGINFPAV